MHKYQLLRERAQQFLDVLDEYSKTDLDIQHFRELFLPWYEMVMQRRVRLPCYEYPLGAYFENPDISPLAVRYSYVTPRLAPAISSTDFSEAIRDRLSDPRYVERLKHYGERPSAVLDELPPAHEVTNSR